MKYYKSVKERNQSVSVGEIDFFFNLFVVHKEPEREVKLGLHVRKVWRQERKEEEDLLI